jgi:hypothetical protein
LRPAAPGCMLRPMRSAASMKPVFLLTVIACARLA